MPFLQHKTWPPVQIAFLLHALNYRPKKHFFLPHNDLVHPFTTNMCERATMIQRRIHWAWSKYSKNSSLLGGIFALSVDKYWLILFQAIHLLSRRCVPQFFHE